MKKIETYQCEIFGRQYRTAEKAQACEQGHKKNLSIAGKEYSENDEYGFPRIINIAREGSSLVAVYRYCWLAD